MRRYILYVGPITALAVGLWLKQAAPWMVTQISTGPRLAPGASSGGAEPVATTSDAPAAAAVAKTAGDDSGATPEPAEPPAPEPPVPFVDSGDWLPLADALPASQESPDGAVFSEPPPEAALPEGAALEEILRIREKLQLNPFEGTVIEQGLPEQITELGKGAPSLPATCPSGDDNFAAALRRVTIAQSSESEGFASSDSYETPDEAPVFEDGDSQSDRELAAALRAACRALEARANQYEDLNQFDRSDDLRALADQLRREARRLTGAEVASEGAVSGRR